MPYHSLDCISCWIFMFQPISQWLSLNFTAIGCNVVTQLQHLMQLTIRNAITTKCTITLSKPLLVADFRQLFKKALCCKSVLPKGRIKKLGISSYIQPLSLNLLCHSLLFTLLTLSRSFTEWSQQWRFSSPLWEQVCSLNIFIIKAIRTCSLS